MTHTDPKPLGGEQYSTPGTSLPAANSPASDERLTQTPEVAVEQNGPGNPGQAVVIEGASIVPEGAMTVQRAPGSEDGQEGDAGALPVIAVRELTKVYILGGKTRVPALQGVSLEVYPGEFVAIMGPSGSGKSTFMNLVGCLDRPTQGEYWLAGNLVSRLSTDKLASVRNRLVGFVFQGFNLLGRATALRNVALPMVYAGLSRRERERRARIVMQLVGLGDRVHHKPAELSGGQQQRVAIARALINGPALLLADEPTGNLDSHTSVEIMGVLQALNEQGLTIVLVTHDPNIAQYARRRVTFLDGRVVRDEPVLNPRSALEEWNALMNPPAIEGEGAAKEVSS